MTKSEVSKHRFFSPEEKMTALKRHLHRWRHELFENGQVVFESDRKSKTVVRQEFGVTATTRALQMRRIAIRVDPRRRLREEDMPLTLLRERLVLEALCLNVDCLGVERRRREEQRDGGGVIFVIAPRR